MLHCQTCCCDLLADSSVPRGIRRIWREFICASLAAVVWFFIAVLTSLALLSRLAAPPTTVHPT